MRIVGGTLRGRTIKGPEHEAVRPTSDRVRESIFNILSHGIDDFNIIGVDVLDLFCGTGALGLEALSRGARSCLFVDNDAAARALTRENIEQFDLSGVARIFRRDALDMGPAGKRDRFALVFADPPYGQGLGEQALASCAKGGWLADGAICVLEEQKSAALVLPECLEMLDHRTYGDTQVVFMRFQLAGEM